MVTIIVCGSRHFDEPNHLHEILTHVNRRRGIARIIHGDARGADRMARTWAETYGIPHTPYPAQWDKFGRRAGFIRNRQMLDENAVDGVVAFHRANSRGTQHMIDTARERGIPVMIQ